MAIITLGPLNKNFKYILLSITFRILNDLLYGFNYSDNIFKNVKLFPGGQQKYFSQHYIVHQIFNNIGTFLISICFYKYELNSETDKIKRESKATNKNDSSAASSTSFDRVTTFKLIYNSSIDDYFEKKNSIIKYLIIIFLWILEEQCLNIFIFGLKDLDFWMIELLILTYLGVKMFKLEIFSHHKCSLMFNLYLCTLKIIIIILSYQDEDILYTKRWLWIPIGISSYLILISIRSYVYLTIKWFMDLKYISPYKLLMIFGLMGAIICTIVCLIATFVKCEDITNPNDNKKEDIYDFFCKIYNEKLDNDTTYFDNFIFYIKNYKTNAIDILKELFVVISGIITYFFFQYYSILVIKYLTPIHLIFSNPIYYSIQKLILLIYSPFQLNTKYKDNYIKNIRYAKFYIGLTGDLLSILIFLVYLEIIELNCYKLNYNLKKNISKRSYLDSHSIDRTYRYIFYDEDEANEEPSSDDNSSNDPSSRSTY